MEKVSIIVPIYGVEKYITQCVESLISQTYNNLEIILVDDGSKDKSGVICDDFAAKDNRIIVLHKQNGGLTSARNYGLDHSTGEWIMHVDGDDWIELNTVELLLNKAKETNADIVFSDFWFDFPEKRIESHFYGWEKQGNEGLKEYITTPWTCLWGNIQKKKLYQDYNQRSPKGINYCEDFHLIVRLCFFADKITKVSKSLYHYRQQNTSLMHNLNKKTEADEMWVYSDIIRFFKEHNAFDDFKRVMAWRSLKATQELALKPADVKEFITYNPYKKVYIWGCPYISKKLQLIMWLQTHKMSIIAYPIIKLRKLLGR